MNDNIKTVCEKNACTGCMACAEVCPKQAIEIRDSVSAYNAVIDEAKCIDCGLCHKKCQSCTDVALNKPESWYQGWASDESIRMNSSSGGLAAEISRAFIRNGGIVCSCISGNGEFRFGFAETESEAAQFAGSKYVKSNPYGIYNRIKKLLSEERKVLFIGLPCQAAAVRLYAGEKLSENLYTADLICHGTPSPKLLRSFLEQSCKDPDSIDKIAFRSSTSYGIEYDGKRVLPKGAVDNYLLSFLCSLDHTENCYSCKYAQINRTGDLTLGDSWSSELPADEHKKGISLILCQTEKGRELLEMSRIELHDVDLERAVAANDQLRAPAARSDKQDKFFKAYEKGGFNHAARTVLPDKVFKQKIKALLIRMKILN